MAWLTCGVLDGLSALISANFRWMRLFQFLASGILGPSAFNGGVATALMGIGIHFFVALGAATVYYFASRLLPFLITRALVFGPLYGVAVHLFMSFVVIPLSNVAKRPFALRGFLIGLGIHMVVVGPSIALTLRRYLR